MPLQDLLSRKEEVPQTEMEKAVSNCKVVRDLGEGGRSSYSDSAESTQMPPYQFSDPTLEQ